MQHFSSQLLGWALVVTLFMMPFAFATPERTLQYAHADTQDALETGAAGCAIAGLLSTLLGLIGTGQEVPVSESFDRYKESVLDCAVWVLGDVAIQVITKEMIGWVNTSFDGGPAYVQNLTRYFRDVVDNEVGAFIESTELGSYLCEPFRIPIKRAITLEYGLPAIERSSCTLTDVFNNLEDYNDFVSGDFSKGGWGGWFNIATRPANNPYGALLTVRDQLQNQVSGAVEEKSLEYRAGAGFQGFKLQNCYEVGPGENPDGTGADGPPQQICDPEEIVTPGSVIKSALDGTLDLSDKRLVNADEINEMLSALVSSLVIDVLTKEEGLRGYNPDEASGLDLPDIDVGDGGGSGSSANSCIVNGRACPTTDSEVDSRTIPGSFTTADGTAHRELAFGGGGNMLIIETDITAGDWRQTAGDNRLYTLASVFSDLWNKPYLRWVSGFSAWERNQSTERFVHESRNIFGTGAPSAFNEDMLAFDWTPGETHTFTLVMSAETNTQELFIDGNFRDLVSVDFPDDVFASGTVVFGRKEADNPPRHLGTRGWTFSNMKVTVYSSRINAPGGGGGTQPDDFGGYNE